MILCEYGCGREAKFQMTSGKFCCESFYTKCPSVKNKTKNFGLKNGSYGKTYYGIEITEKNILCNYGCGREAKFKFKNGHYCCSKSKNSCIEIKNKNSITNKNIQKPKQSKETIYKRKIKITGLKRSVDQINNIRKALKGLKKRPLSNENKKKISERSKKIWNDKNSKFHSLEYRNGLRQRMLNGGCEKAIKGIKRISKPEIKLREMIKEIYPECESQYKILNYYIDIAITKYKLAIEYDGYYHFDTEEHKEYHKFRQEKIENEGWKFYRVTMFDKFPTLEEIKNNIKRIL